MESQPVSMDQEKADLLVSRLKTEIPGLVAAGIVDLDTGEWIALETTGRHPVEFLSYLAATTKAYFEGDAVRTIKSVLDEASRGDLPVREIEEIIIRSTHCLHLLERLEREPRSALAVITTREPKLGLIRTALNRVLREVGLLRRPQPEPA